MTPDDILELAAKVEKLDGPCRRLDAKIALKCIPQFAGWIEHPANNGNEWGELFPSREAFNAWLGGDNSIGAVGAPGFTASLDAAMTLVIDGAGLSIHRYWIAAVDGPVWSAVISTGGIPSNPWQEFESYDAATPALALVAASLRARATDMERER